MRRRCGNSLELDGSRVGRLGFAEEGHGRSRSGKGGGLGEGGCSANLPRLWRMTAKAERGKKEGRERRKRKKRGSAMEECQ